MNKRVTVGVSKGAKCVCGGYSYFDRSQCPAGKWSLFCLFSKQKHLHICGVLKPATCWVRVTSCTRTHKHMFTLSHTHTHTWIQVKNRDVWIILMWGWCVSPLSDVTPTHLIIRWKWNSTELQKPCEECRLMSGCRATTCQRQTDVSAHTSAVCEDVCSCKTEASFSGLKNKFLMCKYFNMSLGKQLRPELERNHCSRERRRN